jgi:nucleotide-binding universal stress UspA family protein
MTAESNGQGSKPVVVGVDGTLASLGALDLAAEEAMARVVPLVVVYTVMPPLDPTLTQHQRLLDLAVSRARADHPGLAVSGEVVRGAPIDVLLDWSHRACLVVVGHVHGDHRSVAAAVAECAAAPVMVFRPTLAMTGPAPRPVLVGVDTVGNGAGPDGSTLEFAFAEAALRGTAVAAVHVWPGAGPASANRVDAPSPIRAARLLTTAVQAWSRRYTDVPVSTEVLRGRAVGPALAGASRDASLLVVGARHQTAGGLVSRGLIDLAGCPVAVVEAPRP